MILFLYVKIISSLFISFDIGTDTIKAAVIRSGRTIEIVLNEHSKRKTPGFVSLQSEIPINYTNVKNITRRVGVSAIPQFYKNSSSVIRNFPLIIGKEWNTELQELFDNRLIDFKMEKNLVNGIEPAIALAMLFQQFVHNAEEQLQQGEIRDTVISVPGYFNDVQRRKVALAAKIVNLNIIKIIDDRNAVALVYALEKTSFFTREPKTVAIVDFGHGALKVSELKFSAKVVAQKGRNPKPFPKIEDLGYIYDETIGGIDFDIVLAKALSQKYNIPISAQLISDAQKLKHALTLSETANITIDSLNHHVIFTRKEFYNISSTIFEKIKVLLSSLNNKFDSIELIGGSSRIPKFIEIVSSTLGNVSHSLNGDESIVVGAAYSGAISTKVFKLMDINYEPTSAHLINLSTSSKNIRLFSERSSLTKLKTARLDTDNISKISLIYDSKISIGCTPLIGEWEIIHEGKYPNVSRIALTYGFNDKSFLFLSKGFLFEKNEKGEINKSLITVKHVFKPQKLSKDEKINGKKLLEAFALNDKRLAEIAEAKNIFESLIFELKNSFNNDPVWKKVTTKNEKEQLTQIIKESSDWIEFYNDFENKTEINSKTKQIEEVIKPIKQRVQESISLEGSYQELDYLLNDMQDAILNRWPERKLHVPKQQKKAILNHIKITKEWLNRKSEEQKELEPWDEPALKSSEIELRIKKLSNAYKNLEDAIINNKLRNHHKGNDFGADL